MSEDVKSTSMRKSNKRFIEAFTMQMEKVIDDKLKSVRHELIMKRSKRKQSRQLRDEVSHDYYNTYNPSCQRNQRRTRPERVDKDQLRGNHNGLKIKIPAFQGKKPSRPSYEADSNKLSHQREEEQYAELKELLHKAVLFEQKVQRRENKSVVKPDVKAPPLVVNEVLKKDEEVSESSMGYLEQQVDNKVSEEEVSHSSKEQLEQHVGNQVIIPTSDLKPFTTSQEKDKGKIEVIASRAHDIKCYKCQDRGHYARECTNKRVKVFQANGEIESKDEFVKENVSPHEKVFLETKPENVSPLEEHGERDQGQLLVARKSLSIQSQLEKQEQRGNLFYKRCLVQDKVCRLIFDGWSCTIVTSETMVMKLCIKEKQHPRSYQIQWLNSEGEMRVENQVVMLFSIGKYENEILCDVLPMKSENILLGRPWPPDKRVIHDDFTNGHTRMFKSRKAILIPKTHQEGYGDQLYFQHKETRLIKQHNFFIKAIEEKKSKCLTQPILLFEFVKTFMSLSNLTPVLPSEIYSVLQGFKEVFPDGIPKGLPPITCIKHLDFQWQISDLRENAHKRESTSLSAIPVLLVPKKGMGSISTLPYFLKMSKIEQYATEIGTEVVLIPAKKVVANHEVTGIGTTLIMSSFPNMFKIERYATGIGTEVVLIREKKAVANHEVTGLGITLILSYFVNVFEIERDAIGIGVGAVSVKEKKVIAKHDSTGIETALILSYFPNVFKFEHNATGIGTEAYLISEKKLAVYFAGIVRSFHELAKFYKRFIKDFKARRKKILGVESKVWNYFRKKTYSEEKKSTFKSKIYGSFNLIRRINDKDYQLNLQGKYNMSGSFNVSDFVLYVADKSDLRSNPFQVGEDDMILISTRSLKRGNGPEVEEQLEPDDELGAEDVLITPEGQMNQLRAEMFKQAVGLLRIQFDQGNKNGGKACPTTLVMIQADFNKWEKCSVVLFFPCQVLSQWVFLTRFLMRQLFHFTIAHLLNQGPRPHFRKPITWPMRGEETSCIFMISNSVI